MSGRAVRRPMPDRRRASASSRPGARAVSAMLSCGQACTQSRQNVQSMLPTLAGRKSPSSQPRCTTTCGDCGRAPAGDAIRRGAGLTRRTLADLQLQRRHRRGYEIELSDRAEMLTERRALEDRVDDERGGEIGQDEIRRRARQRPQVEELVAEENGDEEHEGQPLAAQALRPVQYRRVQPPRPVSRQDKGTPGAEEVAGREQRDNQETPIVDPGEDRGEICRGDIRAEESVENEDRRRDQQRRLKRGPRVLPAQKPADDRPAQHVGPGTSPELEPRTRTL